MTKLSATSPKKNISEVKARLEHQEAYTKHRLLRKRFLHNPYTETNLMDVREWDLLDVHSLGIWNDMDKDILSVIDVFSKISASGIRKDKERPVNHQIVSISISWRWLARTRGVTYNKGKEFLNKHIQDMQRDKGIRFQISKNPDVKCVVVEPAHRTIRVRLYKFFN